MQLTNSSTYVLLALTFLRGANKGALPTCCTGYYAYGSSGSELGGKLFDSERRVWLISSNCKFDVKDIAKMSVRRSARDKNLFNSIDALPVHLLGPRLSERWNHLISSKCTSLPRDGGVSPAGSLSTLSIAYDEAIIMPIYVILMMSTILSQKQDNDSPPKRTVVMRFCPRNFGEFLSKALVASQMLLQSIM